MKLKQTNVKVLKCRSLGHAWDPLACIVEPRGRIRLELRCLRCKTERTDLVIRRKGEVEKRRYAYKDAYWIDDPSSFGTRKMFTSSVRIELIERLTKR